MQESPDSSPGLFIFSNWPQRINSSKSLKRRQQLLAKLKSELREMVAVLQFSPAGGRPARFLAAKSIQARLRLEAAMLLTEQAGLPNLREYVVGQQIVLYAHSETDVVLLALKHQRQLVYSSDTP